MNEARTPLALLAGLIPLVMLLSPGEATAAAAPEPGLPGREPVSVRLREQGEILIASHPARRTLIVNYSGSESTPLGIRWELRIGEAVVGRGADAIDSRQGGEIEIPLLLPLPEIDAPAGLVLAVEIGAIDSPLLRSSFPLTLYPQEPGLTIVSYFETASIALFDPSGRAGPHLEALGLTVLRMADGAHLRNVAIDLIVIGPGGFARGQEALGPILAERARSGTPILVLDQPSIPGTLTDRLRLWPSFRKGPSTDVLLASQHPVFRGLDGARATGYLAKATPGRRPYLPPTSGNFRILAGTRV